MVMIMIMIIIVIIAAHPLALTSDWVIRVILPFPRSLTLSEAENQPLHRRHSMKTRSRETSSTRTLTRRDDPPGGSGAANSRGSRSRGKGPCRSPAAHATRTPGMRYKTMINKCRQAHDRGQPTRRYKTRINTPPFGTGQGIGCGAVICADPRQHGRGVLSHKLPGSRLQDDRTVWQCVSLHSLLPLWSFAAVNARFERHTKSWPSTEDLRLWSVGRSPSNCV
jgi:hypothetical protein